MAVELYRLGCPNYHAARRTPPVPYVMLLSVTLISGGLFTHFSTLFAGFELTRKTPTAVATSTKCSGAPTYNDY